MDERRLSTPPPWAPQQALWLTRHTDWLTTTDYAQDAVDELHDVRWTLATAIGDTQPGQRIACPMDCGTTLRVDIHDPGRTIRCRCGTTWTAAMLLLHGVAGEAEAWVDAESVEVTLGIPARTLRRWAQHGYVAKSGSRYRLDQIIATRRTQVVA